LILSLIDVVRKEVFEMDLPGFLALFHQLFPGFPIALIVFVALTAFFGWLVFGRKKDGQQFSMSVRSGPATTEPASEPPAAPPPVIVPPMPQFSVKAEANPRISPKITVHVAPSSPPQSAPVHVSEAKSPPPPPVEIAAVQGSTANESSASGSIEEQIDGPSSDPQNVEVPDQSDSGDAPHVEMRQFVAPVVPDAPYQEPTATSSANESTQQDQPTQQIDEDILAGQPPLEPSRATPSGRLYSQLPRTDAQAALRMMSVISQETYAYVRARRRDSIAQKPFPNELLAIRQLHEYVTFIRPRLSRLNQALNRLGITLNDPTHDPRWILSAFLDPFSDAAVERVPTVMREAIVSSSQSVADALRAKGFPYKAERKWGAGNALYYSLDEMGEQPTSFDEEDITDFDIDEADIEMDNG
ncbi:MAG: hypothetical protein ACRDID_16855, partial [Ktedonobacterales bacterium]